MTANKYLAIERSAETKRENHDGQVFAMAAGTAPHAEMALSDFYDEVDLATLSPTPARSGRISANGAKLHRIRWPLIAARSEKLPRLAES